MPDDLTIRSAVADDMDALQTLYRHLNPNDPPMDANMAATILERFERYDGSAVILGVLGSVLVSSCTLIVIPNLTRGGAPYALIENVVTDAAYRGRGFGHAVLQAAVDRAWSRDCYKAMLLTGSTTPATHRFYLNAGFAQNKTGYQIRKIPARVG